MEHTMFDARYSIRLSTPQEQEGESPQAGIEEVLEVPRQSFCSLKNFDIFQIIFKTWLEKQEEVSGNL